MRSLMLIEDKLEGTKKVEDFFVPQLLVRNKNNRMAFEYLMAFFLLTRQHEPVALNIKFLDNYDYPPDRIPRLYEEAILLYSQLTGKKVNLHGRRMNPDTIRRFEEFLRCGQLYKYNMQMPEKDFSDTYYHYYFLVNPDSAK